MTKSHARALGYGSLAVLLLVLVLVLAPMRTGPQGLGIDIPSGLQLYGRGRVATQIADAGGATLIIQVDEGKQTVLDFYRHILLGFRVITSWNSEEQGMGRGEWTLVELPDGRQLLVSVYGLATGSVMTVISWQSKEVMQIMMKKKADTDTVPTDQ